MPCINLRGKPDSPNVEVKSQLGLLLSGAVGVALAALIYFAASNVRGALSFLLPLPFTGLVIFLILFAVSSLELIMMVAGLRILKASGFRMEFIYALNALYVAFAAVYAALFLVLVGESNLGLLLAALSLVRWASDFWIR